MRYAGRCTSLQQHYLHVIHVFYNPTTEMRRTDPHPSLKEARTAMLQTMDELRQAHEDQAKYLERMVKHIACDLKDTEVDVKQFVQVTRQHIIHLRNIRSDCHYEDRAYASNKE